MTDHDDLIHGGRPFLHRDHRAIGLSSAQLKRAVADGDLVRMTDRVYVDARADDTRELRIEGARLIVPSHAVASDETAAWIWGVDTHKPGDRHCFDPKWMVSHGRSRSRVEGVDCRQALVDDADVTEIDGLRLTTPVRTVSDLLRKQWRPYALASADAMAHAGLVRPMDVRAHLADLKGYRGIRQARVLARYIQPGAASPGESWTRLRLIDAGLGIPEAQLEVTDAAGMQRFLDLGYRRRKIAIEYDGREFHTADHHQEHDAERRDLLEAMGYRFIVVRWAQVFGTDPSFEQQVGQLLGMTPVDRWW